MIVDGIVEPMELAHLSYRKATYEAYIGRRGLEKYGEEKWQKQVADVVAELVAALESDDNANAFIGGFRLWDRE
jgi:hypothetical protein